MNVLNCLPKLSQPKAKAAIHDIWQAETKADAEKAFDLFIKTYEPKYPKATLCLQKDREELMAFFDFPAQHWQSIRTSNPIESAFATIRHRTKRSKGCLSRDGMLHMMFKLGQCAEQNWRKLRGFDYLAKVITGVTFKDGIETTNPARSPHDPGLFNANHLKRYTRGLLMSRAFRQRASAMFFSPFARRMLRAKLRALAKMPGFIRMRLASSSIETSRT